MRSPCTTTRVKALLAATRESPRAAVKAQRSHKQKHQFLKKSHSFIHRAIRESMEKLMPMNYEKVVSKHFGNHTHKSLDLALCIQEFTLRKSDRHKKLCKCYVI